MDQIFNTMKALYIACETNYFGLFRIWSLL